MKKSNLDIIFYLYIVQGARTIKNRNSKVITIEVEDFFMKKQDQLLTNILDHLHSTIKEIDKNGLIDEITIFSTILDSNIDKVKISTEIELPLIKNLYLKFKKEGFQLSSSYLKYKENSNQ